MAGESDVIFDQRQRLNTGEVSGGPSVSMSTSSVGPAAGLPWSLGWADVLSSHYHSPTEPEDATVRWGWLSMLSKMVYACGKSILRERAVAHIGAFELQF